MKCCKNGPWDHIFIQQTPPGTGISAFRRKFIASAFGIFQGSWEVIWDIEVPAALPEASMTLSHETEGQTPCCVPKTEKGESIKKPWLLATELVSSPSAFQGQDEIANIGGGL